jgi:hypothetical protein
MTLDGMSDRPTVRWEEAAMSPTMNPTSYFSDLLELRIFQEQIVSETRQALNRDAGKMAEALALGESINAAVATSDVGPGWLTRMGGKHAWVGTDLPLGNSWRFYLGSYFEVSETGHDQNDLYVYGAVGLPDIHDPNTLCSAIEVLPPWVIETNKKDWCVEVFPNEPLIDLSEYSLHLGRVVGEWCRIWSSLGGLAGMARKSGRSE